jgi:hypothetical protein
MRDLGVPVTFAPASGREETILIATTGGNDAQELIDEDIVKTLPTAFLRLLSAATGANRAFTIAAPSPDQIAIRMLPGLVSRKWHVAALLNLIDSSTFIGRIDDDPTIAAIEVRSDAAAGSSLDELYADLEQANAAGGAEMSVLLPPDFNLSGGLGRVWPGVPRDYFFDIVGVLSAPIDAGQRRTVRALLTDMDQSLAGSAFSTDEQPEEWFEEDRVPYPVEIKVKDSEFRYRVEFPPSDFAAGLHLVRQSLERAGLSVARWRIDIREGW